MVLDLSWWTDLWKNTFEATDPEFIYSIVLTTVLKSESISCTVREKIKRRWPSAGLRSRVENHWSRWFICCLRTTRCLPSDDNRRGVPLINHIFTPSRLACVPFPRRRIIPPTYQQDKPRADPGGIAARFRVNTAIFPPSQRQRFNARSKTTWSAYRRTRVMPSPNPSSSLAAAVENVFRTQSSFGRRGRNLSNLCRTITVIWMYRRCVINTPYDKIFVSCVERSPQQCRRFP